VLAEGDSSFLFDEFLSLESVVEVCFYVFDSLHDSFPFVDCSLAECVDFLIFHIVLSCDLEVAIHLLLIILV
jgi:hypothetical protein